MLQDERRSGLFSITLWILALACGLTFAYLAFRPRPPESQAMGVRHPAVGVRMPPLAIEPLTGFEDASLPRPDWAGRPYLLNFWGEWCGPCRMEFPHLTPLRRQFEERGGVFLSVSCGASGGVEDQRELKFLTGQFLEQRDIEGFSTYWDPRAATRLRFAEAAQLTDFAYPTTILVDGQGVIQGVWAGYWQGMELEVRSAALALVDRPAEQE